MSKYYMSWYKNKEILLKSSSGGVFTALAQYVLNREGVVFGVSRKEGDNAAETTYVTEYGDLDAFRRSKYYQSDVAYSYRTVRDLLKSGKWVLFSGTPCQNAGLLAFLKAANLGPEHCERLITADVLCHGITNKQVFEAYLRDLEKKYKKKVLNVEFRNKEKGWRKSSRISIDLQGGQHVSKFWQEDPFYLGFNYNLILRPSCYVCDLANGIRCTDFTIGDYWGVEDKKEDPEIIKNGVGLTLVNTAKAEKIWDSDEIRDLVERREITRAEGVRKNGALLKPPPAHANRYRFFAELDDKGFISDIDDCLKKEILKNKVKSLIGVGSLKNQKIDYSNVPLKREVPPMNRSLILEDSSNAVINAGGEAPQDSSGAKDQRSGRAVPVLYEHKDLCNGCYACMNICPVNAISLKNDKEGFVYPAIDGRICVRCGKCVSTCPKRNSSAS